MPDENGHNYFFTFPQEMPWKKYCGRCGGMFPKEEVTECGYCGSATCKECGGEICWYCGESPEYYTCV